MKSTRLFVLVGVLLFALAMSAGAEQVESNYQNGDFAISIGAGFGYGFSLSVYPGAEYMITGVMIGDVFPLQFGVAARGLFNWYPLGWLAFGGGLFGTAHVPLKAFDLTVEWLDRLDFYIGLGLAVTYFSYTPAWEVQGLVQWTPFRFGLVSLGGVSYFLTDTIAVYTEGLYWGYYGGATLGVIFKL